MKRVLIDTIIPHQQLLGKVKLNRVVGLTHYPVQAGRYDQ